MNEIKITVSRFQQAHRCMIRAEAQVCLIYMIVCACLGIEGSKERLLGDLYHSSPSFFHPFQVVRAGFEERVERG